MSLIVAASGQPVHAAQRHLAVDSPDVTSVPRQIVHRADDADVLLTHFRQVDTDSYHFAVRWPQTHALFRPVRGRQNPMLIAETIRQAGTALAHAAYHAPLDNQFLLWDLHYEVPDHPVVAALGAPATAAVHAREIKMRGKRLAVIRVEVELYCEGILVGRGGAAANCVSPAAYRRLRPGRADSVQIEVPSPVPHGLTGAEPGDVMLAASGRPGTLLLRADPAHPVIFDSQSDHVPGRGILEAMRQAAQLATGFEHALAPYVSAEFSKYVELDRPCYLTARQLGPQDAESTGPVPHGQIPVAVTLTQDEETVARGLLRIQDAESAFPHQHPAPPR
ncbi:ScbA/BarX family gamma-butyrolactone biosynthesis protein [Streptomyces physcomitrii]|uniref:A-factor biosynthesis hotdog domain-containing protein n=1 Tax=Streptomyces physcomitrii TaxID=2724184 RepID=A0ABX1H7P8_9ACTN|nr:ScbA/BarX family gamma-butyrolactone biosynthesis protein [Streptomyces physcomitrii]NKI44375.1 hypothetical protein [Streptomyces physcomitrii]